MITDDGVKEIANIIGGSAVIPSYIAIGTGSSTVVSGDTALVTESDRNFITSRDTIIAKDVTFIADYSSTELSGTTITEWGLFNKASAGSMFVREVIGSLAFTGDMELQIQSTIRFARSGA